MKKGTVSAEIAGSTAYVDALQGNEIAEKSHISAIKFELLFEFESKEDYNKNAITLFAPYRGEILKILCLDKQGLCLTKGEDLSNAEALGYFPIRVYRLQRVSEVFESLEQDIFGEKSLQKS